MMHEWLELDDDMWWLIDSWYYDHQLYKYGAKNTEKRVNFGMELQKPPLPYV